MQNNDSSIAAQAPREEWGSRLGFILATIGSAAGIGNIWRFSYVAGENGGGAFLLVYLCAVALVGLPLVVAELSIGRAARREAVGAFTVLAPGGRWHWVGGLGVIAAFVVLAYYAVVAGWALKYLIGSLTGSLWQAATEGYGGFFAAFVANPLEPVLWQGVMLLVTVVVVIGGIRGGIEIANKVLLPFLALLICVLAVWGMTQSGSSAGLRFLFAPDWGALLRPGVYLAAIGQAFFSLGVGMSIFITYGSYLRGRPALGRSAVTIVAGDSAIAILAGVAIFATVFAFGSDPAAGPELAFITLPQIFLGMPGGAILGPIFFGLLVAGAITSMVSILEVPVAFSVRKLGWRRRAAAPIIGTTIFIVGVPASLGFGVWADVTWAGRGILDVMDFAASNLLLPLGGALVAVFVGWRWLSPKADRTAEVGNGVLVHIWLWLLRLVAPALILAIMVHATTAL